MLTENQISGIEQQIKELSTNAQIPGLCTSFFTNDDIIYTKSFGVRDIDTRSPVDLNTLFGIGSCTKVVVSLAIHQLSESGKLSIEDPVNKYVSLELGLENNPIKIKHLLSHISGIPNLGIDRTLALSYSTIDDDTFPLKNKADFFEFINKTDKELVSQPGENFIYLNSGFTLLGEVIEVVSGLKLDRYIEEKILKPLGMNRSTFLKDRFDDEENKASFYILENEILSKKEFMFNPFIFAPGGLMSSVSEFSNFLKMLLNGGKFNNKQLISKKTLDKMFDIQIETPLSIPGRHGYSNGLAISEDFFSYKLISHGGSTHISSAHFALIPEQGIGIVSAKKIIENANELLNLEKNIQLVLEEIKQNFVRNCPKCGGEMETKYIILGPERRLKAKQCTLCKFYMPE